jgi:long-subunit fatty acid transport protein
MQNYQNIWIAGGQTESSTAVMDWSERGFAPKLGVKWTPIEELSFGLTAYHAFILSSKFMSQLTTKGRTDTTSTFTELNSSTKRHTGTQISFGTAYKATKNWLFAADVDFNIEPDVDAFSPNGYQGVINYSLGIEYSFNPKHAVRAGVFTNQSNSNEPGIDPEMTTHINMYGVSTGYSFNFGTTSITVGLVYSFGSGKAQIYEDYASTIDLTRYSLTGVLATSFNF